MLSTEQLREHLAGVTYRPGWAFELYDGRWEGQHLVIKASLMDSFRHGETVDLEIHSMLPPMESVRQFDQWLAWRLGRIEVHEMREWLKHGGRVLFDPHAPGAEHDFR